MARYEITLTMSGLDERQADHIANWLLDMARSRAGRFGPALSWRLSDDQEDAD